MGVHASVALVLSLGVSVFAQEQAFRPDRDQTAMGRQISGVVTVRSLGQNPPAKVVKRVKKAQRLSNKDRHKEAIVLLKEALAGSPDYLVALNMLGVEYDQTGAFDLAAGEFEKMTRVDPACAVGYTNLGVEYCKARRFPDAEMLARRALVAEPTYDRAHFLLAMSLLMRRQRVAEARIHLNEAARTMPEANQVLAILNSR